MEISSDNLNKADIHELDMEELNKIELVEDHPEIKGQILGSVPLFLVKMSRSYYSKVETYTKSFLDKITLQINYQQQVHKNPKLPLHKKRSTILNKLETDYPKQLFTARKSFKGFK